ncbi:MAG: hypothetical protein CM15mP83_0190 [Flavobacteriaceae bacterium]|nr:MAG: hypothetical protein CM15mP83_0190 [Flavobacteriaceae bacterium]
MGTQFESFSYFLGAGYSDSEGKHSVQFTVTGAPQNHYQRTDSWYNMVTLGDYKSMVETTIITTVKNLVKIMDGDKIFIINQLHH